MAITSEITLSDQTRGTEWEYRVIAVNEAGRRSSKQHRHGNAVVEEGGDREETRMNAN